MTRQQDKPSPWQIRHSDLQWWTKEPQRCFTWCAKDRLILRIDSQIVCEQLGIPCNQEAIPSIAQHIRKNTKIPHWARSGYPMAYDHDSPLYTLFIPGPVSCHHSAPLPRLPHHWRPPRRKNRREHPPTRQEPQPPQPQPNRFRLGLRRLRPIATRVGPPAGGGRLRPRSLMALPTVQTTDHKRLARPDNILPQRRPNRGLAQPPTHRTAPVASLTMDHTTALSLVPIACILISLGINFLFLRTSELPQPHLNQARMKNEIVVTLNIMTLLLLHHSVLNLISVILLNIISWHLIIIVCRHTNMAIKQLKETRKTKDATAGKE